MAASIPNKKQSDIVVIGAGIAGASVAAQLALHANVILLEMENQPGKHATGRSAAYYAPAYGNQTVRDITRASEAFFKMPSAKFSNIPLFRQRDSLFLASATQAKSMANLRDENPNLNALNIDTIKQRIPIIKTDTVMTGALDIDGGDLDVDAILQGFLRQFNRLGGTLINDAKVTALNYHNGLWQLTTAVDTFKSPIIVNAAGAWADQIAGLAGLAGLGLTPLKRTAILVEGPGDLDFSDWPIVIDVDENFYFKPDAGLLLLSPADEQASEACDAYADELDIAIAVDRVQQVLDLKITQVKHQWAGLRTFSKDKTFISGFDPRCAGFFWLAGQGGYGVQSCPALADIAAYSLTGSINIMNEADVKSHLQALAPDRFL